MGLCLQLRSTAGGREQFRGPVLSQVCLPISPRDHVQSFGGPCGGAPDRLADPHGVLASYVECRSHLQGHHLLHLRMIYNQKEDLLDARIVSVGGSQQHLSGTWMWQLLLLNTRTRMMSLEVYAQ